MLEFSKTKACILLFALILLCGVVGAYFFARNDDESNIDAKNMHFLIRPVFAQDIGEDATFLEEEAGISMYVNIGQFIDISTVKTLFKTIEKETLDYIVGSISLPNYPETEDVHCFIHKDGWIVVYYLRHEPLSKIIDLNYYNSTTGQLTKTKLQIGLQKVASALGASITGAKYYYFTYPEANKFTIIIDEKNGRNYDHFNLKLPSEYVYYEFSWANWFGSGDWPLGWDPYIAINGTTAVYFISRNWRTTTYGKLSDSQFEPDVWYRIDIYSLCDQRFAIILVYREP